MLKHYDNRHLRRPVRTTKQPRPHSALVINMAVSDRRQELADGRHMGIVCRKLESAISQHSTKNLHTVGEVQLDVDDMVLEISAREAPDLAKPVGHIDSLGVVRIGRWPTEDLYCHLLPVLELALACG